MINGNHAKMSRANSKQSILIIMARRRCSSGRSVEALKTQVIVISSGNTKRIMVTTDGAITLGNKRQSCMYTLPSAKKAAPISTITSTASANLSGPTDDNLGIVLESSDVIRDNPLPL